MDNTFYLFYFLLAFLAVFLLIYLDRLWASPILAIFNRWLRWLTVSLSVAYLIYILDLITRPYWVLAITALLFWFLLETIYNWFAIAALSKSSLPLFPKFENNANGDEWPAQRRFFGLREWLRGKGFIHLAAIRAEIIDNVVMRLSIYQNGEGTVRIQIMFLPTRSGNVSVCYVINSQGQNGLRLITDNYFLPFGGFYPENWLVERRPWTRSLSRLLQHHQRRMEKANITFMPWENDPLADLNDQQHLLERINTDLGFLFPRHLRDECGKITWEGRYRIWKELWLINYFGRTFIV